MDDGLVVFVLIIVEVIEVVVIVVEVVIIVVFIIEVVVIVEIIFIEVIVEVFVEVFVFELLVVINDVVGQFLVVIIGSDDSRERFPAPYEFLFPDRLRIAGRHDHGLVNPVDAKPWSDPSGR